MNLVLVVAAAAALAAADEPVRHFEPQALYGHIDGGAELFLEFGFAGLDVQGGVESYRMIDAAAALGVYLAKCGAEASWPEVRARNTGGDYQLMAAKGTLFLIVRNPDGDPAARPAMIETANALLDREAEAPPLGIWDELPDEGRVAGSAFLFRGRFALDPVFTFGEGDVLQVEGRALGAGARYTDAAGATLRRLVVVYADDAAARAALAHLEANLDPYLTVVERGDDALVLRDHAGAFAVVRLAGSRLDITVDLVARP
jgi:hypothetical protein